MTNLNEIKYKNYCKQIVKILNGTKIFFKDEIKKNTKAFIYKSKISIEDLLSYRFSYIEKGAVFTRIVGKINNEKLNDNNSNTFKYNAIATKDKQISSLNYKNLYNHLFAQLDKIFKFNNKIIIIDGTYSNTNIKHNGDVETSMSLIFYDPINNLNLDTNFS
jgi:hypothetical protein